MKKIYIETIIKEELTLNEKTILAYNERYDLHIVLKEKTLSRNLQNFINNDKEKEEEQKGKTKRKLNHKPKKAPL